MFLTAVFLFLKNIVMRTILGIFKEDETTHTIGVQFWVVVTTTTLLLKFIIGSIAPLYYTMRSLNDAARIVLVVNYSTVNYTLGLMQLSSGRNDFFQVWAVLLVTLQYSVRIGIPYRKSKDVSVADLLLSLWAANLIRAQTLLKLKIPLWFIWSVSAMRIISFFFSSQRACDIYSENMRLVANYMSHEHEEGNPDDVDPSTMKGYKYLVLGEDKQKKKVEPPAFRLELDTTDSDNDLITVERVWSLHNSRLLGDAADLDNRLKDVCLSFALYKLLRRRFSNLPILEARQPKTKRLVFEYILQGTNDYERAFRITHVELRFLRDFFYSKHSIMFAKGFPFWRMFLSVSLVGAVLYLGYVVHRLSKSPEDMVRITNGSFVTYFIIVLVVTKEVWEIVIYVFSQWTKVLILCKYVKDARLHFRVVESVLRIFLKLMINWKWNQKIRQRNILVSSRYMSGFFHGKVQLRSEVKRALFETFRGLIASYLPNAFGPNQDKTIVNNINQDNTIVSQISWAGGELEADTHRILVWHIATSLCEIKLFDSDQDQAVVLPNLWKRATRPNRPLVNETAIANQQGLWGHYITAISLSNYCAYLVSQALVPDNGLVVNKVYEVVQQEVNSAVCGCKSILDIYTRLTSMARMPDMPDDGGRSLVKMGAQLAEQLRLAYTEDRVRLWRDLGKFWTGFMLHLAASTRAAKHDIHLRGPGELTTHLWALLSHAGFLGNVMHGEQMLDPDDINDSSYI
uniref:DUF4220 domain-containing protein n=1 Tax=Leersia perrieri TaxID=77586 RepID=A0A0D9XU74_9ORYZ